MSGQLPVVAHWDKKRRMFQAVDGAAVCAWFAEQLLKRPLCVAKMTGIEQLGYLHDLKKPEPSPTLAQVGQLYVERAKITPNWRDKLRQPCCRTCRT